MTLIKDLIEIPESVQRGDFVLRLAEDVLHPDVVLGNYDDLETQRLEFKTWNGPKDDRSVGR